MVLRPISSSNCPRRTCTDSQLTWMWWWPEVCLGCRTAPPPWGSAGWSCRCRTPPCWRCTRGTSRPHQSHESRGPQALPPAHWGILCWAGQTQKVSCLVITPSNYERENCADKCIVWLHLQSEIDFNNILSKIWIKFVISFVIIFLFNFISNLIWWYFLGWHPRCDPCCLFWISGYWSSSRDSGPSLSWRSSVVNQRADRISLLLRAPYFITFSHQKHFLTLISLLSIFSHRLES